MTLEVIHIKTGLQLKIAKWLYDATPEAYKLIEPKMKNKALYICEKCEKPYKTKASYEKHIGKCKC